jgi:hypothetical protein
VNVDTGTLSAITAEAAMLREHAQRQAPGRHRRPPKPRGWRSPRPLESFWQAGYVTGMTEAWRAAQETLIRTRDPAEAVEAVLAVAIAAGEVYEAGSVPPEWLGDNEEEK